jgi:hypothetical protein
MAEADDRRGALQAVQGRALRPPRSTGGVVRALERADGAARRVVACRSRPHRQGDRRAARREPWRSAAPGAGEWPTSPGDRRRTRSARGLRRPPSAGARLRVGGARRSRPRLGPGPARRPQRRRRRFVVRPRGDGRRPLGPHAADGNGRQRAAGGRARAGQSQPTGADPRPGRRRAMRRPSRGRTTRRSTLPRSRSWSWARRVPSTRASSPRSWSCWSSAVSSSQSRARSCARCSTAVAARTTTWRTRLTEPKASVRSPTRRDSSTRSARG